MLITQSRRCDNCNWWTNQTAFLPGCPVISGCFNQCRGFLWPAYRHQSPHVQVLIPSNFSWSFSCHYPAAFPSHTQEHKLEVILQKGTLVSDLGPGRKQLATFTSSECRLQLLLHKIKSSSVCHFPMLLTDKRFRINWKTISQFFWSWKVTYPFDKAVSKTYWRQPQSTNKPQAYYSASDWLKSPSP